MNIQAFLLLIITALLWGITPILEKIGLMKVDPLTGVSIRSIAVALAIIAYLTITGRIKGVLQVDAKTLAIFSITGIIAGLVAMITYFAALKISPTSQVVPIAATYPLITALLSVLILGEHVTPLRLIGTVFIILGIWFVRI